MHNATNETDSPICDCVFGVEGRCPACREADDEADAAYEAAMTVDS